MSKRTKTILIVGAALAIVAVGAYPFIWVVL
jgi:hypothetical protein